MAACVQALYDAADDDSATGGPDLTRGIFPVVAVVDADGYRRLPDDEVGERRASPWSPPATSAPTDPTPRSPESTRGLNDRVDALLRLARAGDQGQGRLRPQGHRARPQRRRRAVRRRHPLRRREPVARAAQGQRDLRPASRSRRSASTTSSRTSGSPASGSPTCAATPTTAATSPAAGLANAYAQTLGTIFTETPKPYEVEIVVAEVGDGPDDDQLYRLTFDGSVGDEHGYVAMGGQAEAISTRSRGGVHGRHVTQGRGTPRGQGARRPRRRGGPHPRPGAAGGRRPGPHPARGAQVPPDRR